MEFIYIATLIVVIIIGILVYPYWKDDRIYFGLLIICFGLALLYIIHNRDTVIEHLQISGEAVQNVGSIYNQNKMIVKDLEVTGQLKAKDITSETMNLNNNLTVNGLITSNNQIVKDLEINGQLKAKDITSDTMNLNNNLTVNGSITSNNQIVANGGFKTAQWYIEPVGNTKKRLRFIYDDRNGPASGRPFVKGLRPFTIDSDTRVYDGWDRMYDYDEDKETNSKSMMYAYGQREDK